MAEEDYCTGVEMGRRCILPAGHEGHCVPPAKPNLQVVPANETWKQHTERMAATYTRIPPTPKTEGSQ